MSIARRNVMLFMIETLYNTLHMCCKRVHVSKQTQLPNLFYTAPGCRVSRTKVVTTR
jgi:hypothetical protein